jgi:hypothetical protein
MICTWTIALFPSDRERCLQERFAGVTFHAGAIENCYCLALWVGLNWSRSHVRCAAAAAA